MVYYALALVILPQGMMGQDVVKPPVPGCWPSVIDRSLLALKPRLLALKHALGSLTEHNSAVLWLLPPHVCS